MKAPTLPLCALAAHAFAALLPATHAGDTTAFYLRGPTDQLSLGTNRPNGVIPLAASSAPLTSSNFVEIGTWKYVPFTRPVELTGLDDLRVWLQAAFMDVPSANLGNHTEPDVGDMADAADRAGQRMNPRPPNQARQFDLRGEILKNGQIIASGLKECIKNLKTVSRSGDSTQAKEIKLGFDEFSDTSFGPGDVLSLRILARTVKRDDRPTISPGLIVFFDSVSRPARFTADLHPIPTISITGTVVSEGNSGTASAVLRVTLSERSSRNVTVRYATADGTATVADSDYTAKSGTLEFDSGQTNKTITIRIRSDLRNEPDETLLVRLSDPSHAVITNGVAPVIIRNDDGPPTPPSLTITGTTVAEGDAGTTNARLAVTLSIPSALPVSVSYTTADGIAMATNADYTPMAVTLAFNPGETAKFISIPVNGDLTVEPDETFLVLLSGATNATISVAQATVTIRNDDFLPVVAVVSPARGLVTNSAAIVVTGTTGPMPGNQLKIEGGAAPLTFTAGAQGNFTATVALASNRLNRLFITPIDSFGRSGAPQPVEVTQDAQAPSLYIDFPADGAELYTDATDVAGRVGDMLAGFMGLTASVNGQPANVNVGVGNNGTFGRTAVPLVLGDNTITATAADISGNTVTRQITVRRLPVAGPRLLAVSGNAQQTNVHIRLPTPITVRLVQGDGITPIINQVVTFDVTRSDGRLLPVNTNQLTDLGSLTNSTTRTPDGIMHLDLRTDANGQAAAWWTLGGAAGSGGDRVCVTSPGISNTVFFCATATPRPARQINIGTGNNQRGEAGAPAVEPLRAWVSDSCNGVEGMPVTFRIIQGGGSISPLPSDGRGAGGEGTNQLTIPTTRTGHASVLFTYGPDTGNNLIEATFPGNPGNPATFVAYGVARDPNLRTTFTGLVLDNSSRPIGGAHCVLTVGGTNLETHSDVQGQFRFDLSTNNPQLSPPLSGPAHLHVDGLPATNLLGQPIPQGSYPALAYSLIVVHNAANSLPTPVLLPRLNPNNARVYYGTNDVELTCEGMDGLKMLVKAGSMRRADGSIPTPQNPAILDLNQVQHDKVPMPMPDGVASPFAWTLQPGGATFDPPIQIQYPNMSGLPAGSIAYFLSFNHDTERFEIVASGHVLNDSTCIVTDPGAGLNVAGWGGNCPPYAVSGEACNVSIDGSKSLTVAAKITLTANVSPPGGTFGWSIVGGTASIISDPSARAIEVEGVSFGESTVRVTYRPPNEPDPSMWCSKTITISVVECVLGIHSNVGPGADVDDGHAWITLTDFSVNPPSVTTYGLWPDLHCAIQSEGLANGSGSDVRMNFMGGVCPDGLHSGDEATGLYNRYYGLNSQQKGALLGFVGSPKHWSYFLEIGGVLRPIPWYNCASFASDAVRVAVGDDVDADDVLGFETPRELGESIGILEAQNPTQDLNPLNGGRIDTSSSADSFRYSLPPNPFLPAANLQGADGLVPPVRTNRPSITPTKVDGSWSIAIAGQTMTPNSDGAFSLPNISAPDQFGPGGPGTRPDFLSDDFLRLTGTSTRNGVTRYVASERFQISQGQTYSIQDLIFSDTPPVTPESLRASIDQITLTALGQTTQLRVTATYADGTTNDVTPRSRWTVYRTSNPQIATVGQDGLVTAVGPGIALLTAGNEGATTVAQIIVAPGATLTTVTGLIQFTNGQFAAGVIVTISGLGLTGVTDSNGRFTISNVPTTFGPITLTAQFVSLGVRFVALARNLPAVPSGTTDAGVISLTAFSGRQVSSIAAGDSHSLALRTNGTLWAWGKNRSGQLGIGLFSSVGRTVPTQVGITNDWIAVAAGMDHTLALKTDGSIWAWGANSYGQLGIGTFDATNAPTPINSVNDWVAIAAGWNHSIAVKSDGSLWAWGYNGQGQLGNNTFVDANAPSRVGNSNDWTAVAGGGYHTLASKADGSLWAWGWNSYGQLGNQSPFGAEPRPRRVGGENDWGFIAAGTYHSVALKIDGSLWAWGANLSGQNDTPTRVGSANEWAGIGAGTEHTAALQIDGSLWTWGQNSSGQLGDGTTISGANPVRVATNKTWTEVSAGRAHTLARATDGTLWAWGDNSSGQLGGIITTPVPVETNKTWVAVSAGEQHSMALTDDGALWACGNNSSGQLGDGTTTTRSGLVPVATNMNLVAVTAARSHTLALAADGSLWAWGNNFSGQLGDETTTSRSSPIRVATHKVWRTVSAGAGFGHTMAVATDGTLWAWGNNTFYQLGDGTFTDRSTPVHVAAFKAWAGVSAGDSYTLALATDGTLWAWGDNGSGRLGDGTMAGWRVSPVPVAGSMLWLTVDAGSGHSMAMAVDNTLWAWGGNSSGQLGDGTIVNRFSPVAGATNRVWVTASAGGSHTLALATDGTLWAWGANSNGQLGDGTTTNRLSPVPVALGKTWATVNAGVSHTLALATDGTLWAWGANSFGQLGIGPVVEVFGGGGAVWGPAVVGPQPAPFLPAAVPVDSPLHLTISISAAGSVALNFTADTGRSYIIEGSTNLTTWMPLSTNVAAGATLRYTDAESKTLPYRFYRARLLP